ncbi:DUF3108 domain-containing protein [Flavobacterium psychrophilum]|uniref:DUF3108 domain-containing protein n=1 Tax=Flavobacterium psychrophilum TaxID=96345 RepID=UPI0004F7C7D9|nr:DUF3108 domain-containing protein [Flavobacterium psychrophilum]AIN73162.1 hypothetical protein FPG3_01240 [Flavobacterium psychrophilum FPG3]EKT2070094.1 DUF3108 domain-containing protein [Flavobacterium psychrophilum]EKT2072227.1 DUF3108 domain-containing protein [Flavobacterium psychrophilum]EKT3957567.1 DUF3108 domain-containing protein [Flavobacterium psychrophilum]EKT3964411.1 DUF3108 domain-containing protein [Flavobacterium psychrophilum]
MKKKLLLFSLIISLNTFAQNQGAFDVGEWFKFRIHYGMITAGYATLEVKEAAISNKKVFYTVGHGYTSGMAKTFFKVEDHYQSFIDKTTYKPYQFLRKIDEGGYTKNQEGFFNQDKNTVLVKDHKNNTDKSFNVSENVQDIVSAFYYLRNHPNINRLNIGESIMIDMFFDDEITKFKLKFMGRETIKTSFGKVKAMIFRPLVQSGRVFKEEESLTVWISDDENKIPLRIKASLAVGSLKADLEIFKGLKNPFMVIN